ncbi:MAG: DUF1549 domain-containing protein, partial [Armatimonadetes bacterium]|nr:DUF1549 domain-containing protein [Armatimonadota bacterium]
MVRPHAALIVLGLILAVLTGPGRAQGTLPGPPTLDSVLPTGGRRGTTVEVALRGVRLADPVRVLLGGSGVEVREIRPVSDQEVRVGLVVRDDAELGPRRLRLVARHGLSDPAWFVVGTLPEVMEQEPNDTPAAATALALPAVVSGAFGVGQDVDWFRFRGSAGTPCVVAVEAYQYDSQVKAGDRWQFAAPVLEVQTSSGRVVAAAVDGRQRQPAVAFRLPEDGEYRVRLHELAYLGGVRGVYRLTVGNVPYPLAVLSAGGRRGTRSPARVFGLNLPGDDAVSLTLPDSVGPAWVVPFPTSGRALPCLVGELPEIGEREPNDSRANRIEFPATVNGSLDRPADEDRFELYLRRGEGIRAEVFAGRVLGTAADMQLSLFDAGGRPVAENDDDPATLEETRLQHNSLSGDSCMEFAAPAEGFYTLRVRDLAGRGGGRCVYRLQVNALSPGFALTTRYDNPTLPGPGGTGGVLVNLRRWGGFTGAVRVRAIGLPDGFRSGEARFPALPAGAAQDTAIVTITAPETAQPGDVAPFGLEGSALVEGRTVTRNAEPRTPVGDNYRAIPFYRPTDGCVACVVPPGDLQLSTAAIEVRGPPGQAISVPISVERLAMPARAGNLVALSSHHLPLGNPVAAPFAGGTVMVPLRIPPSFGPGVYSFVIGVAPTEDVRWRRISLSTPSIRLVVTGTPEREAGPVVRPPGENPSPAGPPPASSAPARERPPRHPQAQSRQPGPRSGRGRLSFTTDVLPALTRAGCSQGACHGASAGRGGFRLSLWGSDPEADYVAIVREGAGRRVARSSPSRSLLLQKPTLALPHGGGRRLTPDRPEYRVLADWLAEGAPGPSDADPRLRALTLTPADQLTPKGTTGRVRAIATFENRDRRDVTSWVQFASSQPGVASVAPDGRIRALGPGETVVSARYQDRVAAATVAVPFSLATGRVKLQASTARAFGSSGLRSEVDLAVERRWARLGLVPSPLCSDTEFLRRVWLDLTGTLPDPDELASFLQECRAEQPGKRAGTPSLSARR